MIYRLFSSTNDLRESFLSLDTLTCHFLEMLLLHS